jgi:hypothetical protein
MLETISTAPGNRSCAGLRGGAGRSTICSSFQSVAGANSRKMRLWSTKRFCRLSQTESAAGSSGCYLGSIGPLLADLRERGIVTKVRHLANGRTVSGIPFTRGPLSPANSSATISIAPAWSTVGSCPDQSDERRHRVIRVLAQSGRCTDSCGCPLLEQQRTTWSYSIKLVAEGNNWTASKRPRQRARTRVTCRSCKPRSSSWSSMPMLPARSMSPCRRRCSAWPTK